MPYLICDKCKGYYELQEGESLDDFKACQCGGKLEYVEELPETLEKENKTMLICSNCLKESEEGTFCPNCGGRLIELIDGRVVNHFKHDKSDKTEITSNVSKKSDIKHNKEIKSILEKINVIGIMAGSGFFVISIFILLVAFYSSINNNGIYNSYNFSGIVFEFITIIIISLFIAVISGALASFISNLKEYEYGIINGLLVGIIAAIILGSLGGIFTIIIAIFVYGILSAAGGAVGIFIRTHLRK